MAGLAAEMSTSAVGSSDQVQVPWDLCDQVRPQPSSSSGQSHWPEFKSPPNPTDSSEAPDLGPGSSLGCPKRPGGTAVLSQITSLNTERTVIGECSQTMGFTQRQGEETDGHSVLS